MVQFGSRLTEAKQKKWASKYVDYDRLKGLLGVVVSKKKKEKAVGARNFENGLSRAVIEKALTECGCGGERVVKEWWSVRGSYAVLVQVFDLGLVLEFEKVEALALSESSFLKDRWAHHRAEDLESFREGEEFGAEETSLRRALSQLHSDANEILEFVLWNFTAFAKITKKRDKMLPDEPPIRDLFVGSPQVQALQRAEDLRSTLAGIQLEFARLYCDDDLSEAELRLRDQPLGYSRDSLRLGYRAGVAAMLSVWVLWDCVEVVGDNRDSVASKPAWPVFRVAGELVAWHWMWGACVHVWTTYRVNVDFLFDTDPRAPQRNPFEVYDEAAMETILLLALLLVYYKATYRDGLPACVAAYVRPATIATLAPVVVVCVAVMRLVLPWHRRKPLWGSLGRVVAAPCRAARFVDAYVADVASSMVRILGDAMWSFCFLLGGVKESRQTMAVVCLLPVWFRFAQCLRKYHDDHEKKQLFNAAKYALSLFVALSSALQLTGTTWLVVFCLSSAYSWYWDVFLDWGLGTTERSRMYPSWWYATAVVFDVFGRFVWLATLIPPMEFADRLKKIIPEPLVPMLALAELARRCVWGFFRLEYEHVSHVNTRLFVPTHFTLRRPPKRTPPRARKIQSFFESLAIAALVITLLVRISSASAAQNDRS
ncbi:hypothetical protein CTAYLR_004270 [Chrysophaeum taylorii]|uniref:EXS domain-containing protein n=1 Tax=Chrysophaeum taylorii TaxID=2483200 RepID=A0AAD7UDU4_9STRA|nr:hypothetical protein CTAYLR_004270 [Chrysophaeum taylorii]